MDSIYFWVGFSVFWSITGVISLFFLVGGWYLILAPIQRTFSSYLFLTINRGFRHESLEGLSEVSVIFKILRSEFKPFNHVNTSAVGDKFGYRVDRFGVIRFWKDKGDK